MRTLSGFFTLLTVLLALLGFFFAQSYFSLWFEAAYELPGWQERNSTNLFAAEGPESLIKKRNHADAQRDKAVVVLTVAFLTYALSLLSYGTGWLFRRRRRRKQEAAA